MTREELEMYFENAIMDGSDENHPNGRFTLDVVITDDDISVVDVRLLV